MLSLLLCLVSLQGVSGHILMDSVNHLCDVNADCPLWTVCNNGSCVCRETLKKSHTLVCDEQTLQLSVVKCHCVTFDPETNELHEGSCIENCGNKLAVLEHVPLPLNVSEVNELMCVERWNRTGRLCGKCLPGHSPWAYSYDMRCVECSEGNRNVWKYILVAFGPLTFFYFLVLFLKINVTSSHLHGYVIFSQIISTPAFSRSMTEYNLNHPNLAGIIQTIGVMYGMWNLDFFRLFDLGICLDVSTLAALALDYAVAVYPLLLTVISYILIELHARNVRIVVILWRPFYCLLTLVRRNWDSRTTVIDAYATFFVLSFTKVMCISADFLIPVRVTSLTNDNVMWVLYYDATVDYFGSEHLPYAILAIVCLLLVMMPLLILFLYQLSCFQKCLACMRIQGHILTALMDSYHGGYKDSTEPGTRDYRWFSGVPLVGRALLLLTWAMLLDSSFLPVLTFIIVCIIVLMANVQPYKNRFQKFARIDITFWGFLAAFYALDDASMFSSIKPVVFVHVVKVLRVVVTVLPLLYIICITAYYILSRMKRMKVLVSRLKAWSRGYLNLETDFVESLPDRVRNPERYHQEHLQYLANCDSVSQACNETINS